MKSVLLTGLIVNHEVPISRSDREVEYKIIGLKGIDLYTLSETELSINESATRVISCEYEFETGEYSLIAVYFEDIHQISSVCIKTVGGVRVHDILHTKTVVYNANLDVMFNWHNEPIRASLSSSSFFEFCLNRNKVSLELRTIDTYKWKNIDFSFVRPTDTVIDTIKNFLLIKIGRGLYKYDDKLIVFEEFDGESLIIPEDTSEIILDGCTTVKNIVFNRDFKSIDSTSLEATLSITSIAISRSLSYKQFTEIVILAMSIKRVSDTEFARYYDVGNYEACFKLFRTDKKLSEEVFGNIEVIVY